MINRIVGILLENKPSIYLYGSVVLNDFKFGWSDIDILCLTQAKITENQAKQLVNLRQELLSEYSDNLYFRSFEGGLLSLDTFISQTPDNVVYWGTSGQRITDNYYFDAFSTMELIDSGRLLYGEDVRELIKYPTNDEIKNAIVNHYNTIRKYAVTTNRSLYSFGWFLDIARCLYTLLTGKIISKTAAGEWALNNGFAPDVDVMKKAIEIRKEPNKYKTDKTILDLAETLGVQIQCFADVLEKQLYQVN
jgi:hypothetical protein